MGIKIFLVSLTDIVFGGHHLLLFQCSRIRHSLTVDTLKRKKKTSFILISYQSKCPDQMI